ncbi:MAG TPA: ABA4-like family protein [Anaerolineae bacterium]|nr:ABA4-like family protein [Anaerolineae bacterium]
MEILFQTTFLLTGPFWLLMILAPHWRWTQRIMLSPLVITPIALLYVALILPLANELVSASLSPTLATISATLATAQGATAAWAHLLAFDLFVGRWAYLDSRERRINAWLMALVLCFILLVGPFGFLLYLVVRAINERLKNVIPTEAPEGHR